MKIAIVTATEALKLFRDRIKIYKKVIRKKVIEIRNLRSEIEHYRMKVKALREKRAVISNLLYHDSYSVFEGMNYRKMKVVEMNYLFAMKFWKQKGNTFDVRALEKFFNKALQVRKYKIVSIKIKEYALNCYEVYIYSDEFQPTSQEDGKYETLDVLIDRSDGVDTTRIVERGVIK